MPVFNKESKLSDVILHDPSVIQVVNRFDIYLGVGDATIRSACESYGIDENLFLAIINTYLNRTYIPSGIEGKVNLEGVLDYLEKTDHYYLSALLPNIERHFALLLSKSASEDGRSNLFLLKQFFLEVKEEMSGSIDSDLKFWFPRLRKGEWGKEEGEEGRKPYDWHVLEEKLSDLIHFFVIHLRGKYDRNLCVAVVSSLVTLEKDIQQNNRIRERILKPLCQGR